MKKQCRLSLSLEALEDRACPSLTVSLTSSYLRISGTPTSTTDPLSITQVGGANNNLFQVKDGTHNLGTYRVSGSLYVNLTSRPNDVDVVLNGGFVPGNVQMQLGNGYVGSDPFDAAVNVASDTTGGTAGGTIRGSLIITGGNGQEFLDVGGYQDELAATPVPRTPAPITIRGNLTASTKAGAAGFLGDQLQLGAGTRVGGNVQATQVDSVTVGEPGNPAAATVGGALWDTNTGSSPGTSLDIFGTVSGSVTMNTSAAVSNGNEFTLESSTGSIGKILSVSLGSTGSGANFFSLGAGTTVGGSATLTNNGATSSPLAGMFDIEGQINSSLTLNLGSGDNSVTSDTGAATGDLAINGGDGNDSIGGFSVPGFSASVGGNLTVHLGSGSNVADVATAPTGTFNWTSGNGPSSLTLDPDNAFGGPAPTQSWNVNFHFGNDDDSLTLADATSPQTISGLIDLGGRTTGNSFSQGVNWFPTATFEVENNP